MLYQINLVKDRVVPRNLAVKRLAIVGSEVGFFLIVTLIIGFMGLRKDNEIREARKILEDTRAHLQRIEPDFQAAVQAETQREEAQKRKAELSRLWLAPINFGVVYEMALQMSCTPGEGYTADDLVVRKVEYGLGSRSNEVIITLELKEIRHLDPVLAQAKKLFGDKDTPTDLTRRAGLKVLAHETPNQIVLTGRPLQPTDTGCFLELTFEPEASFFFANIQSTR